MAINFIKTRLSILILLLLVFANGYGQQQYKIIRAKLPMSADEEDYYVKTIGVNYILNGDIIVGNAGQNLMIYQSNLTDGNYIWPKGDVPVKIDRSINDKKGDYGSSIYQNALDAISDLNKLTNLRIVPYTNQRDYIRIVYSQDTGYGGLSPIGRRGGEQIIYITRESGKGTIIHELLHSLGFWHEQSRYDRDNFVVIDTNNVLADSRHNFQMEPGSTAGAYDYQSIMHYPAFAFAVDRSKPTIRCKNGNVVSSCVPERLTARLSNLDISGINASYWFNRDVAVRDYYAELPYDDNLPVARKVQPAGPDLTMIQKSQRVVDKPLEAGIYMIRCEGTGKYLEIAGASIENGAVLQQRLKSGGDNQRFAVSPAGSGLFLLKAMHSDKFLNVTGRSLAFRAGICQWDYVEQANLKFYITYHSSGKGYTIRGLESNMSWALLSQDNDAPVVQDNAISDIFIFERVGDLPPVRISDARIKMIKR
ncbi:MAG: hypothetical protein EOO09_00385 [Chitinophagaceae bacterium]|nr:MAG: hypothetical protein EOO09_00385 [Chitinophagaceae bacterium]